MKTRKRLTSTSIDTNVSSLINVSKVVKEQKQYNSANAPVSCGSAPGKIEGVTMECPGEQNSRADFCYCFCF